MEEERDTKRVGTELVLAGQRLGIDYTSIMVHGNRSRGQLTEFGRSGDSYHLHAEQEYPASRAKARQAKVEPPVAPKNAIVLVLGMALETENEDHIRKTRTMREKIR